MANKDKLFMELA
jgi:dCMP deaminase